MNRFALAVAVVLFAAPASAERGRNAAAAAGAIGGLALGAVVGSALAAPRPVYVAPAPIYAEPVEECYVRRVRVWVPGLGWEFRRRTICE